MTFDEVLEQIQELLQRERRVSYRGLKRRFALDDDYLEDLKEELIGAKRIAIDEDGRFLVWVGAAPVSSSEFQVSSSPQPSVSQTPNSEPRTFQPPVSYTSQHLAERIRAEQAALEARGSTDEERKTITALFADLKGSTALIEGLDPEEARAIIDPALHLMMEAVRRYGGHVAQALGDGIFALFGAPIAHEDHPQRALYAALRMQDEMRRYSDQVRLRHGVPLAMRVGVNTGEVVVRSIHKDDLHADYVPVGHATNLAARMEQMATPGSILITEDTYRLTEGYFAFRALGKTQIKGAESPLSVYEVLGVGPLRTRLQVSARRGLTRFVGRQNEMDQLHWALEQTKTGQGQIIGIMGEPGLGKSRLFYEFKLASQDNCLILEAYSVSHGKTSPYLPVIELLKTYFQFQPQDDERHRRQKIIGKVLELDRNLEDILPYLFSLLGVEEQPALLQQMDPRIRRQRTFAAIKKLLLRESLNQPLILIFEDLHWIDSETQSFLDVLSESVTSAKLLLLVNYRPEYHHEWEQKTCYTQLRLAPFGTADAGEFLTALLGTPGETPQATSLHTLKQLILEKTEGTPFFMEEIVQELAEEHLLIGERGNYQLAQHVATQHVFTLHLPTTVQGILAARIDRLTPTEKALLQQLAVIGREFSLSLVRRLITQPEEELSRGLSALQGKEFLYEQAAFPEITCAFKHALTQEVAYNSVLIERRKLLHEQTAQTIEHLYQDLLEEHYDELAHHYTRSQNSKKAIEYLHKAGQQARQRFAHTEAVDHLTAALGLLSTLPSTPERMQQELDLQLSFAASLQATKGPAAPEVEQAYIRARELLQQQGESPQLFSVLRGLWVLHHVRANLAEAHALGEQLRILAEQVQDSALLLEAHQALGSTLLWQGEFSRARIHLEQAIACYDPQRHQSLTQHYGGAEPGVSCLCEIARVLWFLGYPDQALQRSQAALTLAQKLSDLFSLSYALIFAAGLHQLRREGQMTQRRAEEGIALAREHGFTSLVSAGTIRRGWALAEQGHEEEGLLQMQQGLTARQTAGAELAQPYFLALQAEIYNKLGRQEQATTLLAEALTAMSTGKEHRLEAELYRLEGELTLQQEAGDWRLEASPSSPQASSLKPPVSEAVERKAEECFLKAIAVAKQQQAKSLELRATMSLTRLWQSQGKQHSTRNTLSEIYHWFTEGFDTKDLQEAKALLEALSP